MADRPATKPTSTILATIVLDHDVLRQALIEALSDGSVLERLAHALRGNGGAAVPTFMTAKEYAAHARMSARSLDYARQGMTERVHFSRNGRRVRYHVSKADQFLSEERQREGSVEAAETDLEALARQEAAKRFPQVGGGSGTR